MRRVIPFLLRDASTTIPTTPFCGDIILGESPQHRADRMLSDQAHHNATTLAFLFEIEQAHAPALRSVIQEMGDMVVSRLSERNTRAQAQAYTAAIVALAHIRAAVFPTIAAGDPNYRNAHD